MCLRWNKLQFCKNSCPTRLEPGTFIPTSRFYHKATRALSYLLQGPFDVSVWHLAIINQVFNKTPTIKPGLNLNISAKLFDYEFVNIEFPVIVKLMFMSKWLDDIVNGVKRDWFCVVNQD